MSRTGHHRTVSTWCVACYLLLSMTVTSAADTHCYRWNCPCAGLAHRMPVFSKRWNKSYHSDVEAARRHTQEIVNSMITNRFRDEDHIALLRDCSNTLSTECTHAHIQYNCTLDGLPSLPLIKELGRLDVTTDTRGFIKFVRQTRSLLAKLAVFVDQARRDEESHVTSRHYSMANSIRLLEEQHLYHILCNLDVDFVHNKIAWTPAVSHELMQLECRRLDGQAPIDNRNFMIFYTLERLLHTIGVQFKKVYKRRQADSTREMLARTAELQTVNG